MMPSEQILRSAFDDTDLPPSDLPRIDLYMDQILTLFNEELVKNKRYPGDKLLTKTMVNNYSKEHLILPLKGKKYSREQLVQMLCILGLKQSLALSDIHALFAPQEGSLCFERAYEVSLRLKERLRGQLFEQLREGLDREELEAGGLSRPEQMLAAALVLSSAAGWMRRACEKMIDGQSQENKK